MIAITGLSRRYAFGGSEVCALRDVSLTIGRGDYVALVGPSGSGKSTLLHILGFLDRPSAGSYRFEGCEVGDLEEDELSRLRREDVGFVFQFFHLLPRLTALGNVEVPMLFAGVDAVERRARARHALAAVGLAQRMDHRPEQLSGGERQRVAIARSIVMDPKLVLADEPTGNLDRHSAGEVIELLEGLNGQGRTLVVVTHDPAIAARAARVLRMEDGACIEDVGLGTAGRAPASAPRLASHAPA